MQGLVVVKKDEKFSRLSDLLKSIGHYINKYNWLITNIEYVSDNDNTFFDQDYVWIEGNELIKRVEEDDGFWIWGVFSAFEKDVKEDEVLKYPLPYADGYEGFWKLPLTLQNPKAELELVEWDGDLLLVISKEDKLLQNLKEYYTRAYDLEQYIKEG